MHDRWSAVPQWTGAPGFQQPVMAISCVTKSGIPELIQTIWQRLQTLAPADQTASKP